MNGFTLYSRCFVMAKRERAGPPRAGNVTKYCRPSHGGIRDGKKVFRDCTRPMDTMRGLSWPDVAPPPPPPNPPTPPPPPPGHPPPTRYPTHAGANSPRSGERARTRPYSARVARRESNAWLPLRRTHHRRRFVHASSDKPRQDTVWHLRRPNTAARGDPLEWCGIPCSSLPTSRTLICIPTNVNRQSSSPKCNAARSRIAA